VELLAVLGILMILLGLFLPSLGGAYSTAKLSRESVRLRDHATMIAVYANDHKDTYPFIAGSPLSAGELWARAMLAGGYYTSLNQLDNRSDEIGHGYSTLMSAAMVYDWRLMQPGRTVVADQARAVPVQTSAVLFPSLKGLVFRAENEPASNRMPSAGYMGFCCTDLWEFPVANADSSVIVGHWRFFNGNRPLYRENGMGTPVMSTWLGVRGTDR
jgi:type II secretory pathway pseudopilin PulG